MLKLGDGWDLQPVTHHLGGGGWGEEAPPLEQQANREVIQRYQTS